MRKFIDGLYGIEDLLPTAWVGWAVVRRLYPVWEITDSGLVLESSGNREVWEGAIAGRHDVEGSYVAVGMRTLPCGIVVFLDKVREKGGCHDRVTKNLRV